MRKVKRHLAKELEATNPLPAGKLGGDDLARALERMREAMAAAFAAAHASSSVELLHTWRKRTKNYLHALAFVEGKPSRRQRSAARISHILGEDHDLALLEAELAAGQDGLETQTLLSLIAARRANLRRQLFRR